MAAIMPRPAKPTPANAPPRLPLNLVAATGELVAVPATGPGSVLPLNVVPPPLGAVTVFVAVATAGALRLGFGVLQPRQNAFSYASPDDACTPPSTTLNEPPPVIDPTR